MSLQIDPCPAARGASFPALPIDTFRIALLAALLLLSVAFAHRPARADEVTGYDPAEMQSGEITDVTIQGSGFGRSRGEKCVWYGHDHDRIGRPSILAWSNTAVQVRMRGRISPRTYWLAIHRPRDNGDCVDLRSNLLETFRVTEAPVVPDDGGAGAGAAAPRDLAIVGVTPGIGTPVAPQAGRIDARIRVRNRGTQAQTFALTDGRPRIRRGPLGGEVRGGIETTPSTRLASGAEAEIPMAFDVGGDQDAFTRRRVWLVSPGAIPVPFVDANGRDNEVTIWYRLQASAYVVKARVTKIRVEDDCDNVSPGEWIFRFSGRIRGREGAPADQARWPRGYVTTIDSGDEVMNHVLNLTIHGVRENETLVLEMHAMDCDAALWGDYLVSIFSGIEDICNGQEEPQELSGSHDFPGQVTLVLTPAQWRAGGTFGGWSGRGDCGSNAYHVNVEVSSSADF